jgi:HD-like signal output (HDOD) protein
MTEAMTRILFVDDEPRILDSLRRMLRRVRDQWDAVYAESGPEALKLLETEPRDVIVSDIRMPHMTGVELLQEVRRRHPGMVRMVLSGQASRESVLAAAGPTHQYLPKPCSFEALKQSVESITSLSRMVADEGLRAMICGLDSLPSLPSTYDTLVEEFGKSEPSRKVVDQAVEDDVAMAAKMMQLVSSGFFGPPQEIGSPAEAVQLVGLDVMQKLVLDVKVFRPCDAAQVNALELPRRWRHTCGIAACARMIAVKHAASKQVVNAAWQAAYMHGVGKILLAKHFGSVYADLLASCARGPTRLSDVEEQRLGVTHGQAAAYLAGLWGMATPVLDAVRCLDRPGDAPPSEQFTPLAAVHIANGIVHRAAGETAVLDESYLAPLGVAQKLTQWQSDWMALNSAEVSHV